MDVDLSKLWDQHLIDYFSELPNSPSAMDNSRMTRIPAKGFAINTIIPNAIRTAPSQEVLSLKASDTQDLNLSIILFSFVI